MEIWTIPLMIGLTIILIFAVNNLAKGLGDKLFRNILIRRGEDNV